MAAASTADSAERNAIMAEAAKRKPMAVPPAGVAPCPSGVLPAMAAGAAAATAPSRASAPPPTPAPAPPQTDTQDRHAELVVVPGHPNARACEFPGVGKMSCVYEAISQERHVTGVLVSGACPFDVLVAGGPATAPDWLVFAGAEDGATVTGAALPIKRGSFLTVGIARRGVDALPGLRCGVTVTWSEEDGSPRDAGRTRADAPVATVPML